MDDYPIEPRPMVLAEFERLVGEWFLADCDPEPVKIRLIEATPLRPSGLDIRPPFVLKFHTPPSVLLATGAYVLRCGEFGPDLIHISSLLPPINAEPGYYYQAVFN